MRDNPSYHAAAQNGIILPLDGFFTALQQNGIGVTPTQIAAANKVVLEYADKVPDEAALCHYLCPLFATNEAQQKRFRELFAEYFQHREDVAPPPPPPPPPSRKWIVYVAAVAMLLLIGWWIYKMVKPPPPPPPSVTVTFDVESLLSGNDGGLFQYITKDTLRGLVQIISDDTLLAQQTVLKTVYRWGDNTAPDTIGYHVYKRSGIYTAQASVKVVNQKRNLQVDTVITAYVRICDFPNTLQITTTATNDSVPLKKPILLRATVNNPRPPDRIEWEIRSDVDDGTTSNNDNFNDSNNSPQRVWAATKEGAYTIVCKAIYDSLNSPCTFTTSKTLYAHDPNKPRVSALLKASSNAKPLKPQYKVKPYWYWALGGGLLLFMALSTFFWQRYKKLEKARENVPIDDEAYQQLLASFASDQSPGDVPFLPKNDLVPPGSDMAIVGRLMRRRIEGEALYMHIGRTIGKAVRNSGYFDPVMVPRTRQSEYLMLVEESHINSQQTKLFDYLADTLRRHNVFVEKYYYRYEPSLCYNNATPNGITLEKLSEKYPTHVLVIAGHGHQLLYPYQPMVSNSYQNLLNRWQYKAILTPLPYPDWGVAEKNILPTVIPVFPADIAGQLLMMQALADGRINIQQALHEQRATFYEADTADFEEVATLAAYCDGVEWAKSKDGNPYHNVLFQWIAALAVYPKLQWQLTLAIGKSILDAAGQGHELTYTNLLRLARIAWMKTGILPQELRLELLKELTRSNEVLTRETILAALAEIPNSEVKPGHAAYEEKEVQRIINEFNLYAYDPEKYAAYAGSKSVFERLWSDKKVMEAPVKKYLRNEQGQWPTLINSRLASSPNAAANISINDYFKPLPPAKAGWVRWHKILFRVATILTGVCTWGLISMLILQLTNSNRFSLFTKEKDLMHGVTFTVKDSATDKRDKTIFVRIGDSATGFSKNGSLHIPLSDSAKMVSITVNGEIVFDTFMVVDKNHYDIMLIDKPKEPIDVLLTVVSSPDCGVAVSDNGRIRPIIDKLNNNIWKNIRYVTTNTKAVGSCLTEIRIGKGVTQESVEDIRTHFANNGFTLTLRPGGIKLTVPQSMQQQNQYGPPSFGFTMLRQPPGDRTPYFSALNGDTLYSPKDGEIIISGTMEEITASTIEPTKPDSNVTNAPIPKPDVYLQISDTSLMASVAVFRRELISRGFSVNAVQVMDYDYNSEIYYFDKVMAKRADEVARLYNAAYPTLQLQATLRSTTEKRLNDNRIVIWIKKKISTTKPPTSNRLGDAIIKIAQAEVGTIETPPGSNKTKYGEWYDAKLNATGTMGWSAVFVAWVYYQAGRPIDIEQSGKGFASFTRLLQYAQTNKLVTNDPQPGDVFIIARAANGGYSGGIFVQWKDQASGTFSTIEGNIAAEGSVNGYVGRGERSIKTQKVYFVHLPSERVATMFGN